MDPDGYQYLLLSIGKAEERSVLIDPSKNKVFQNPKLALAKRPSTFLRVSNCDRLSSVKACAVLVIAYKPGIFKPPFVIALFPTLSFTLKFHPTFALRFMLSVKSS